MALEYLSRVLAQTPVPLRVQQIAEQMQVLGYKPRGAHPEGYVRQLLNEYPRLFEKTSTRHWKLKSWQEASEEGIVSLRIGDIQESH
jgi:hypothetical protein